MWKIAPAVVYATITAAFTQVAPTLDPGTTTLVRDLGVVAVLVWYVIYDVRYRQPRMLESFSKEQEELREAFRKEGQAIRATFANEQAELRLAHSTEIQRWQALVLSSVRQSEKVVREVRDASQVVVTEASIAIKKSKDSGTIEP